MNIEIKNLSDNPTPHYQTEYSAGVDLYANNEEDILLKPLQRTLVPTGIYIALPKGFEAQIRPRSGLAYKHGLSVLNTPGTIDSDYRGEVKVILVNLSDKAYLIKKGERVCQMVIAKHEVVKFNLVSKLDDTDRGEGGFGSTGK